MIHVLIQSPTLTSPVTGLVKQHAKIAIPLKENFRDHDISQKQGMDYTHPPSPLTGHPRDAPKTSKEDKKKGEESQPHTRRGGLSGRKMFLVKDARTIRG